MTIGECCLRPTTAKTRTWGNLQSALAKFEISAAIGLGVGSLIGGYLPVSLGKMTAQIQGLGLYPANPIALCTLVVIQFFLTLILIHESPRLGESFNKFSGFQQLLLIVKTAINYGVKHRILFMLILATLAWGLVISGLELLWQPQVKNFLGSESQTWIFGLLATGYFLSSALGNILINPICKVFKNNYCLILIGPGFSWRCYFFVGNSA